MVRRCIARVFACGLFVLLAAPALAWSDRPVTIVSNFGPGSANDILARLLAPHLTASWGQPVVVTNVTGAAGVVGVDRVVRSPPDGHTLVLTGDAATVVRISMEPKPPYDPRRDVTPISQLAITPNLLVVANNVPARNLAELVELAKRTPGRVTFAHIGAGTSQHIGGELLKQMAGVDLTAVSYNDAGAQVQDVLAGRVTMSFNNVMVTVPRVKDGQWRAFAVSSAQRVVSMPDIPTVAEQGYPGFMAVAWLGLLGPAGIPPAIAQRIQRDAVAATNRDDVRGRLIELGIEPVGSTPEEFALLIQREIPRMARILEGAGVRAQ